MIAYVSGPFVPAARAFSPTALRRAQKLLEAASLRIGLSNSDSAKSFLSRAFSPYSSIRRFAAFVRAPPYSLR